MAIKGEMFCPYCQLRQEFVKQSEGYEVMTPMCFWKCSVCGFRIFSPDGRKPRSISK